MVELDAVIESVVYHNDETNYTVLTVKAGKTPFSAVGILPNVSKGETISLKGDWVDHPMYGRQLKVVSFDINLPDTADAIERYLTSGIIRGIGPSMAKLIVARFGDETLKIMAETPERLSEVSGIGKKKAQMIAESYAEHSHEREALMFFQKYNISPTLAMRIIREYGEDAQGIVQNNPYRLVEDIEGIGFKTADSIAHSIGISADNPFRVHSGIIYALTEAMGEGNCYLPRQDLLRSAKSLLNCRIELVDSTLDSLLLEHGVKAEILPDEHRGEIVAVYLNSVYSAENRVSNALYTLLQSIPQMAATDPEAQINAFERNEGVVFHSMQRKAIMEAVSNGMSIITGGPGTGKTTIIKCILQLLGPKAEIALAAPTGRAAKRMSEACEHEASTIHRLLEFAGEEEGHFQRDEDNPLDIDTLIIDEMSMVDIFLMNALLKAIRPGTRLIMVGDDDQLPSVGPGNVLHDMLQSGVIPYTKLTEIFRQDDKSMIVYNAHQINLGKAPIVNAKGSDFFFERTETVAEAAQHIISLCTERLPKFLKISPKDIQVLSPTKKGECGVYALNILLQAAINPPSPSKPERVRGDVTFRVHDKVMQTRNNYNLEWEREGPNGWEEGTGVFNGDIGYVNGIDNEDKTVSVIFEDGREVTYGSVDLEDLELAYCISIHKSQGSEFKAVVIPSVGGPPMLLNRNLIYTGVTRAKQLVVLVGKTEYLDQMIHNTRIRKRNSALCWRLQQRKILFNT